MEKENAPGEAAVGALRIPRPGFRKGKRTDLLGRLRLAKSGHAVAFLPLAALAEELHAFEPLEDVAFGPEGRRGSEAVVL